MAKLPPHLIPTPKYEVEEFDRSQGGPNCLCTEDPASLGTRYITDGCGLHSEQQLAREEVISAVKDAAPAAYDPPPDHYASGAGIDPWAVWDAFDLDRYTANAVKYLLRAGKKDIAPRLDDLIKARNYINKAIEREQAK